MGKKNKVRLVALIEEVEKRKGNSLKEKKEDNFLKEEKEDNVLKKEKEDDFFKKEMENKESEREYKVINFLPDIKVEKIVEDDVHLQDSANKYRFRIVKKDIFQIPYTKEFKDLTVIVGENGTGKTMLINNLFRFGFRSSICLIYQKGNQILVNDPYHFKENIALEHEDEYKHDFLLLNSEKSWKIIKFSNANEYYNIDNSNSSYRIDSSKFENINNSLKLFDIKNKEDIRFWETINQVKFVHIFKDEIRKFVDYTKKGVTIDFEGERLPNSSNQLEYISDVDSLNIEERKKNLINDMLVAFYSILINYMIDIDYDNPKPQKYEHLLNFHLSMLENASKLQNASELENQSKISLQYKSIGVDKDKFLPYEYSIGGLRQDVPNIELGDRNSKFWIEVWHSIYIINLYFEYIRFNKGENDEYKSSIEGIIKRLKALIGREKVLPPSIEINDKLSKYLENINIFHKEIDNNDFEAWKDFWETVKTPCIRVAKAISYTSYFELKSYGYFVKLKLIPQKVMDRLRELGVHDDEIELLEDIGGLLSKLDEINMDFEILTSLIENISKLENINLNQFLEMKWGGLSSGELALLKTFSNLYSAKIALQSRKASGVNEENYLLLLDEVDLGLHPRWQRKWISTALPIIEKIFEGNHLQIIITTHSPIFLSDIFEENIIFLPEGREIYNYRTFGQNIYSLFKNAFFLNEDEFIGEYAYQKIQDTIEYLRFKIDGKLENLGDESLYSNLNEEDAKKIAKKIIDSIGEKIMSNQLYELFTRAFPAVNPEADDIKNQIRKLENKLRELGEEVN